jgi:hypothetical protein
MLEAFLFVLFVSVALVLSLHSYRTADLLHRELGHEFSSLRKSAKSSVMASTTGDVILAMKHSCTAMTTLASIQERFSDRELSRLSGVDVVHYSESLAQQNDDITAYMYDQAHWNQHPYAKLAFGRTNPHPNPSPTVARPPEQLDQEIQYMADGSNLRA